MKSQAFGFGTLLNGGGSTGFFLGDLRNFFKEHLQWMFL